MNKPFLLLALALVTIGSLFAQASPKTYSAWTLAAAPSITMPLMSGEGGANTLFAAAWGGSLGAEYALPSRVPLAFRLGAGYSIGGFLPSGGIPVPGTMNEAALLAGVGIATNLTPALSLGAFLDAGLAYGSLSTGASAPYAVARAGGGIGLGIGGGLSARLDASFTYKAGLYGALGATLGMGYRLPARATQQTAPARPRLLELSSITFKKVFPVLRSYYDLNPVGAATIVNTGKEAASDIRVSFLIRQYMDAPKECATIARLEPGAAAEVPLYGLFNDSILDVTEATKVTGEVVVEYGGDMTQSRTATVVVYDRNALTWSDDRKAAAFVSARDPLVLDLTGNIIAAVKSARNAELPKNYQTAIAVHEGLRSYGIGYMLSTTRPFAKAVVDPEVVDTLKFPRQTLGFRAGDCADLSVLYASCLEAAGVETAFVTIPGHIFMAIDLGLSRDEARSRSMNEAELILQEGRLWLPIETTMRDAGFLEVWRKGAAEWREASAKGTAAFYPIHEAWKTFAPMGLPADGSKVPTPSHDVVVSAFQAELAKAVEAELGARLAALGPAPAKDAQGAKAFNDRGVLYGKYGKFAEAERDFRTAAKDNFVPAIVNLGNISMLRGDAAVALAFYQQGLKLNPNNAKLLVSYAKSAAALGKSDIAAAALERVRQLDPKVADQYAALAQAGTSGTRAAEVDQTEAVWF